MNNWKRVFAIIWTGQFTSIITSSTVSYALLFWLSLETGSARVLAYGAIASLLPQAVLGFITGVYVDRWNRKTVMMAADSFVAVCTLVLVILMRSGETDLVYVYIVLTLRSFGSAFHMPAMQASIPLLAPESQLMRIAGINQIIQSSSNIAGPALGALFLTLMDIGDVLLLDVFGAAVAVVSLLFVRIPSPKRSADRARGLWRETKEGIMSVTRFKGLNFMFLMSIVGMLFLMQVSVMFPLLTLNHFGGGAWEMSLIEVVWGLGALAGGAMLSARQYRFNKAILLNTSPIVVGAAFSAMGLLPAGGFAWFVALTAVSGVAGSIYNATFTTIVQLKMDPAVLGRVFSLYGSLSLLPALVGLLGTGFLADNVGMGATFFVSGLAMAAVGVASFLSPSLMALDRK